MLCLSRSYPKIINGRIISYGGNQMWADNAVFQKCACGPVAALDLLHYIKSEGVEDPIPLSVYNKELSLMIRRYFPLLPPFGINGWLLAAGLNRIFRDQALPYRAFWAASGSKIWARVSEMLSADLPVILSVGPNFPAVWMKKRLRFFIHRGKGVFIPSTAAKSHYVTITGMDEQWLRISSWGREYYISRREYEEYVRKNSNCLFSNILYIKATDL